jgi:FdhE protein
MGRLDSEAGKRYLQCCLCRTDWVFGRVECPFCGNNDQEFLRYFHDEKDTIYRVDVCDTCKAYIKTIDMRNAHRDVVVALEYLATLELDIVARREGFHSATAQFAGV